MLKFYVPPPHFEKGKQTNNKATEAKKANKKQKKRSKEEKVFLL